MKEVKLPSNKKFGFFFTIVFFVLFLYFYDNNSQYLGIAFLLFSVSFLLITVLKPSLHSNLNKMWMNFGFILGKLINPIVMGVTYFFLFVPLSLIMKLFGRDELKLKLKDKKSFWIEKSNSDDIENNLTNQY